MSDQSGVNVDGSCAPGFERVRDAFEQNFIEREEIGAAVAVWVDGDLVVNLWGGSADGARQRPWREDTLASIFSGSKGLTSTCVHLLADCGEIDLHATVAKYWPEFGQAGKEAITIASVMGHRSGVIGPRTRLTPEETLDWDGVCRHIAAAEPWWEPGTAQGYHMVTFGFILGEIIRRVTGRTLGQFLRTEVAEPLGIDVHVGLPASEHHRCAEMINKPNVSDIFADMPREAASLDDHPRTAASVTADFVPDDEVGSDMIDVWRSVEFPSTNGHVTALGMSTFYNALAQESSAVSTWSCAGYPRAASTSMWSWGRGSPTTGGVWATC